MADYRATLFLLLLAALATGLTGCPDPQPRLDSHQYMRLNALQGQPLEGDIVQAIGRADGKELEFHIRTLEMVGTGKSATLLELIRDTASDEKVRTAAAEALSRVNAREEPDLLKERTAYFAELEKTVGDVRLSPLERTEALMELAFFGEETAEATARAIGNWYARKEANIKYRNHALRIAYRIPSPAALDALVGFDGDVDWYTDEVPHILEFAKQQHGGRYRDVLRDNLKKADLRLGAALVLGADGDDAVIPYVKEWLGSQDEDEMLLALQILQNVKDPRVLEISVRFLDRKEPAVLKAAINALGTNYEAASAAGGESQAYQLIAARIGNWPEENRRQALQLLVENKETGPRDLYYKLATNDDSSDVRRLAISLRGNDPATANATKDRALLQVLENDRSDEAVMAAIDTLSSLYAAEWVDDATACAALMELLTRTRGEDGWRQTRKAAFGLIGWWGRYADARRIESQSDYEDYAMLHGRWSADRGERGDSFSEVPEYAAVEDILARHQKEFAEAARKFDPGASDGDRAFVLHWIHLADGPVAKGIWEKVVNGKNAAKDLAFFQPFSLPRDPYWLEMFNLLARALDSKDSKVADTAFQALQTRYLVRNEDGSYKHGQQLREVFNEGDTRGFVRVLTPIFKKIVEGKSNADRQGFMLGVIRDGVLPGEEVAVLAQRLFEVSLSNAQPELAKVMLAQLQKDVTGESFVEVLVPVMVHALAHPDSSVRRMVADIIRAHFGKIRTVRSQVSQMVTKACQSDDAALRSAGRFALENMARWAAGSEGLNSTDLSLVREAITSILSPLAGDSRRETREAAAGAVGAVAPLARNPNERKSSFFREMRRIGQTFAQRDDDLDDPTIMRPVATFFAAIGDENSVRSTLVGLLDNKDLTVRLSALEGLSKQVTPDLIQPLQQWIRNEDEGAARERGLVLYARAGVQSSDLGPAVWLMTQYPHRRPADTAVGRQILDAWSKDQRSPRDREKEYLRLCKSEGEEVYPLLLPALQEVASTASLPLMQSVVADAGPGPRALAAGVLARIPDNMAADALLERLINDEKEPVRLAAITAAGEVGRFKSMAGLLDREATQGEKLSSREATAIREAISGIVKRMNETLEPGDQIHELIVLADGAKKKEQRAWFLDRIAEIEHESRSGALQQFLSHRDDVVRLAAVRNLLRVDGEAALELMADRAKDSHKPVRQALADFCATHDGMEVRRMLEVLVKDDDEAIRLRALDALTKDTNDPSVLAVLRRVLQSERDTSWKMRRNAVDKLANFRVAGTLELMYGVADDDAWQVRESALRGLGRIWQDPADLVPDDTRLEAIATNGLGDSSPEVKMQALDLVRIGRFTSLLDQVKKLAEDRDRAVRVKAQRVEEELRGE